MHLLEYVAIIHGSVCRLERHDRQEGVLGAEDAVNVSEDLIEVGEYVAVGGQDTIWKRMGHKARKIFLKRLSIVIFYPALDLKNLGNAIGPRWTSTPLIEPYVQISCIRLTRHLLGSAIIE
jgi:hypothetical protein